MLRRAARGSLSLYVRLCRPTGCLRQAAQPAPAGMCPGFRFQVSGLRFFFPPLKTLPALSQRD